MKQEKVIVITVSQAWKIRNLLKELAELNLYHKSEIIDCHNWLEHEMIKQLKGD